MAYDNEAFLRWPSLQAPRLHLGAHPWEPRLRPAFDPERCPDPGPQACEEWQDLDARDLPCRLGDLIKLRHCWRAKGLCEGGGLSAPHGVPITGKDGVNVYP